MKRMAVITSPTGKLIDAISGKLVTHEQAQAYKHRVADNIDKGYLVQRPEAGSTQDQYAIEFPEFA